MTPIGYHRVDLGLNNQKIALLGLISEAIERGAPLVIPNLSIFRPLTEDHKSVPFHQIYSLQKFHELAHAFGIEIVDTTSFLELNGWSCFERGAKRLGAEFNRGYSSLNCLSGQLFKHLSPLIVNTKNFAKLYQTIFYDSNISVVCQLRIETDWIEYSDHRTSSAAGKNEYIPSFQTIMKKVKNSLNEEKKNIYIVCDEANLPLTKDEIRQKILFDYGINLIWKTDILSNDDLEVLSSLDLSIIDFEMAVRAPVFVSNSHSTFSMLASFESFCRNSFPANRHFLYNLPVDKLVPRTDNGASGNPAIATDSLYQREPLIPIEDRDLGWPICLMAHISNLGDFETDTFGLVGLRDNAIVVGKRDDPLKQIEGFSIEPKNSHIALEYRGMLADGTWTSWVSAGFVGTKGENRALKGFDVRLTGALALSFECLCIGAFAGRSDVVYGSRNTGCSTEEGLPLEAIQLKFYKRLQNNETPNFAIQGTNQETRF